MESISHTALIQRLRLNCWTKGLEAGSATIETVAEPVSFK